MSVRYIRIGQRVYFSRDIHLSFFQRQAIHMQILPFDQKHSLLRFKQDLTHIEGEHIHNSAKAAVLPVIHQYPVGMCCHFFFHNATPFHSCPVQITSALSRSIQISNYIKLYAWHGLNRLKGTQKAQPPHPFWLSGQSLLRVPSLSLFQTGSQSHLLL